MDSRARLSVAANASFVTLALAMGMLPACGDTNGPAHVPVTPWSIIVLPDTQVYMDLRPEIWFAQSRWISENAGKLNAKLIVHVGDITEWNSETEWTRARQGLDDLEATAPVVLVPGNHDYDTTTARSSRLSEFWPAATLMQAPTFGGLFEPDRTDNSYHLLDIEGSSWLVIGLEWGPRDAVLDWAAHVLDSQPADHVLIATHAYLYKDNRRYDWAAYGDQQRYNPHAYVGVRWPEVNDGEEIWQKLIANRDNVDLVISGHVPEEGVGRLTSTTDQGHRVHQLLANFQSGIDGGSGYLRIMTFHTDRIDVETYSPYLDQYEMSPEHTFSLQWAL